MRKSLRLALSAAVVAVAFSSASAYLLEGPKWPGPTIPMVVQLGAPSFVLPDGSLDWNKSAENCLAIWNEQMANAQFTWTEAPTSPVAAKNDGKNSAQFSATVFGSNFGSGVLAVTTYFSSGPTMTAADVNFNSRISWSSSGTVQPGKDFHRVALHEFGHVLGLDHPDQAKPAQTQASIMHSTVGGVNALTTDDANGAQALYGAPAPPEPVSGNARLANISTRARVETGDNVLIAGFILRSQTKPLLVRALGPSLSNFGVAGALADPSLTLYNQGGSVLFSNNNWADSQAVAIQQTGFAPPDSRESAIEATLEPANYTAVISGVGNSTGVALAEVYDLDTPNGRAYNISTRGRVSTGDNVMIAGFVIRGPQHATLIIRALGPSLQGLVNGAIPDTKIELRNSIGQLIASNTGWQTDTVNSSFVSYYQLAPGNAKDSALYAQLVPGNYTVIFSSPTNASGIGLIEVYDLSGG